MSQKKVALLFPGQGACYAGVLGQAAGVFPEVGRVFADIDAVAVARLGHGVSDMIWGPRAKTVDELLAQNPAALQLTIFGTSVAVYRLLAAEGLRPDVLVGHSFGEIAALVCGGAFTASEGAEIVCDRVEAARLVAADGYMAAIGANPAMAHALVDLVGNHDTVVAGENGETQTVLSGVRAKMDRVAEIAKVLNVAFLRLNSPCPFHSPLMEPVRAEFKRRLQRFTPRPLALPVYSPIAGRRYAPADRLTDWLADHLVQPVRFAEAVGQLYADGFRIFVECGALDALARLTAKAAPGPGVTTMTCLGHDREEVASLRWATGALRDLGALPAATTAVRLDGFAPAGLAGDEADAFWNECGTSIGRFLDQEFERFRQRRSRPTDGAPAGSAPRAQPASAAAPPQATPAPIGRAEVFGDLVSTYATALEYPEEVFTEHVELEAELGIDSVKQTELLARVSETYGLPQQPADFRLSNYNTLGKVADFVVAAVAGGATARRGAADPPAPAAEGAPSGVSRDALFADIVAMYAAALEYPEEVFTSDVALEAELGIDSVKQTELLARLSEQYGLPARPAEFRLSNYDTLGKVTDFVFSTLIERPDGAALPRGALVGASMAHVGASEVPVVVSR